MSSETTSNAYESYIAEKYLTNADTERSTSEVRLLNLDDDVIGRGLGEVFCQILECKTKPSHHLNVFPKFPPITPPRSITQLG